MDLNVVLLGKTQAGKSAAGNTILGRPAFISKRSTKSVTQTIDEASGTVCGHRVTVHDTPGFSNTDLNKEEFCQKYERLFQKCDSVPCVYLLVIKAEGFAPDDIEIVEKIKTLLGEKRQQNTWILFTRGDELEEENITINEFLEDSEPLKNLVQKYEGRYHVFKNKRGESEQVNMLFKKIIRRILEKTVSQKYKRIPVADRLSDRRLVLLGKSGVGKSAVGNTILGQKVFISKLRMKSVTRECLVNQANVSGRNVSVIDTPGLFDTDMNPEDLATEIARSVYLSSPGPHAFLIVFPVNQRFTPQEQQIAEQIEMMFGEEVLKYSIILFTHGDQLKEESMEKLIVENVKLRSLVQKCGGKYHVFNNKERNNRQQVTELLQKIDTMIQQNGGGHYTNQMIEDALRCKQEEEEERRREEEEEERLRVEEEMRQQKTQRLKDIWRLKNDTEKRVREVEEDKLKAKFEMLKLLREKELRRREEDLRRREEDWRKQQHEKQQQEIERLEKKESSKKSHGFKHFFSKYKHHFIIAAFVVTGIIVGGVVGSLVGGVGCIAGVVVGGFAGAALGAAIAGVSS